MIEWSVMPVWSIQFVGGVLNVSMVARIHMNMCRPHSLTFILGLITLEEMFYRSLLCSGAWFSCESIELVKLSILWKVEHNHTSWAHISILVVVRWACVWAYFWECVRQPINHLMIVIPFLLLKDVSCWVVSASSQSSWWSNWKPQHPQSIHEFSGCYPD